MDLDLSIWDVFVKTKIFDKRDYFDFDIVNFPFLVVRHPMVFTFPNLFALLECPVMSMTLILVIKFWQQNFVRHFQNFIGGILT